MCFFVWGSKAKETEVARGEFFCPECGQKRQYIHKRVDKYFTIYWIPMVKTDTLVEFVECVQCHRQFKMEVLNYKPPSEVERIQLIVEGDLQTGTPLQIAYRKLLNAGIAAPIAGKLIRSVCGDKVKICRCKASFVSTISQCTLCGAVLRDAPMLDASEENMASLLRPLSKTSASGQGSTP